MATPSWFTTSDGLQYSRWSPGTGGGAAYVLRGPEQVKRDLWKAVTDGNVDNLRQYQGLPSVTHAAIGVNSRTGWTIVHEAVERGHSGAMLSLVVQLMGSDSVNKKTRTGLTPAHVAASKRDTVALMALANLGADLSVLAADRVQLRELQKQASEAPEPPGPLEQARLMLATLEPSALAQPKLETMQSDLATTKKTLETASERVQREALALCQQLATLNRDAVWLLCARALHDDPALLAAGCPRLGPVVASFPLLAGKRAEYSANVARLYEHVAHLDRIERTTALATPGQHC